MFIQSPPLGAVGLVPDLPNQSVPLGGWNDGNNMRFDDGFIKRIPEPRRLSALVNTEEDTFTGVWYYNGDVAGAPATGHWTLVSGKTLCRVHKTDDGGGDRGAELLALLAGSTLKFVDQADPSKYIVLTTFADAADGGTFVAFQCTVTFESNGGPTVGLNSQASGQQGIPATAFGQWMQQYEDSTGPRIVYATDTALYRRNLTDTAWDDVTRLSGPYLDSGTWQSFQWGTSVVFNNGVDTPQILYDGANNFVDLPGFGVLTSGDTNATCRSLRPYRNFMVACDVVINGTRQANAVWWSDAAVIDNDTTSFDAPSWDYEDPGNLSGLNYVGVEDGPLVDSLTLNANQILYTATSSHLMTLTGGDFVFTFQRLHAYGIAALDAVANYSNLHFCVGPDSIWVHDGSTVKQIADGRIQTTYLNNVDFSQRVVCEHAQSLKEIHTLVTVSGRRRYLIYNYKDDTWTAGDATVWNGFEARPVNCISYGFSEISQLTWDTWTETWNIVTASWAGLSRDGREQAVFWLTDDALNEAEAQFTDDPSKAYYLRKDAIDFSELDATLTSNLWNYLRQIYPHITTEANTQFTVTWSATLAGDPDPNATKTIVPFDPDGYKVDLRTTGRYLNIQIDVSGDGAWTMTSMDYDMEPTHGR